MDIPDDVLVVGLSKLPSVSAPCHSLLCVLADPTAFSIMLTHAFLRFSLQNAFSGLLTL